MVWDPSRLTTKASEALAAAQQDALQKHHPQVTAAHLLSALIRQGTW